MRSGDRFTVSSVRNRVVSDSSQWLAYWLENAHDLLQEVSVDGRFLYVNRAWRETLGYTQQEVRHLNLFDVIHPESRKHCEAIFDGIVTGTKVQRIDTVFQARDGRTVDVEGTCHVRVEGGTSVAIQGIFRDVTDRKRLETELRQAQKMQALGLLASGVAHNFGNLLTAIAGTLEWMRSDSTSQDRVDTGIAQACESIRTATAITDQLRKFGRRDAGPTIVVDINTIVKKMANLLEQLLRDIRIETRLSAQPSQVRLREGHFDQVIMNLALNSRDAMPDGGKLSIETANGAMPTGTLVPIQAPAVVVTVQDTGVGMDAETREHVYEPFFTTKAAEQGTGLGLSTVFGMVKQAGGTIAMESAPGEGTSVTIHFPAMGSDADP